MAAVSAGILLYRSVDSGTEVLLVHPGGPFWAKKNEAAWSIPKGLVDPGEDHLDAAKRELFEETGVTLSSEPRLLGTYKQPGSKSVEVWVVKADGSEEPDPSVSSRFEIEWPPHSGKPRTGKEPQQPLKFWPPLGCDLAGSGLWIRLRTREQVELHGTNTE